MLKRIVYRLYERRLLGEVKEGVIPRHLGLIQDGNRRFAQEAGISKLEGYRLAAVNTEEVLSWCSELTIPSITLWWLSDGEPEPPRRRSQCCCGGHAAD